MRASDRMVTYLIYFQPFRLTLGVAQIVRRNGQIKIQIIYNLTIIADYYCCHSGYRTPHPLPLQICLVVKIFGQPKAALFPDPSVKMYSN